MYLKLGLLSSLNRLSEVEVKWRGNQIYYAPPCVFQPITFLPLRSPMRPLLLLLLPKPRLPKRSKSHSKLERGRNSDTIYLIQFALQLHYLPPAPCCSDYLQSMDAHCYGGESSRGGGRPWRRSQGQGQLGHVRYFSIET